jgi:DNA mismatch endonuclease (patch repair protein)
MPLANNDLWLLKFEATRKRDRRVIRGLRTLGWDVLVIWECQIGGKQSPSLVKRIRSFLERSRS